MNININNVKTIQDIVNYSEALASDIEAGVINDACNAQLIAEFAIHCAGLAIKKSIELNFANHVEFTMYCANLGNK